MSNRFIVVSNRLPVTVKKVDGEIQFTPSPGGLATAMSSIDSKDGMMWIGWPGITSDDLTTQDKRKITKTLKNEYNCVPVFLTEDQNKNFYEGFSNDTLWPLFHYFQSTANYTDAYWQSYKDVNNLYAKTIKKHAGPNATIWIHDYHLLLLPQMVREAVPSSSIGFFLHIPFPSYEIFRQIPQRRELLMGLLGSDLIGFHIYDYVRHFNSSVTRILGYSVKDGLIYSEDRIVKTEAFPISIDYQKFNNALSSAITQNEIKVLKEHYGNQKIILSVDRLDYSKGIEHRLDAYELFLKRNPKLHKKVSLVMIAVPSRIEVEAYKDLRDQIEQTVSRINGTYGSVDWAPVSYQFQNQPFEKLVALYAHSSIALVTPVRDGMNLVAKEFIACKKDGNGVLILSEFTGASDDLPEAVVINPNDTQQVAKTILQALRMPLRQQRLRLKTMQQRIRRYSIQTWAKDFLSQLDSTKNIQSEHQSKLINNVDLESIVARYFKAKKRLLILDYDGTLKNFVDSPGIIQARPRKKLLSTLKTLCDHPGTRVFIISGRPRQALDSWFGKLPVELIAEHGYWIKQNNEWRHSQTEVENYKSLVMPILLNYTERTPGAVLEDKTSSVVWHYRNVSHELAFVRKHALIHELKEALKDEVNISIHKGNKIIEVKPSEVNKGQIIENLNASRYDFVMAIGDDYTDEDMFEVLKNNSGSVTIKVGLGSTAAQHQHKSVQDTHNLLRLLSKSI